VASCQEEVETLARTDAALRSSTPPLLSRPWRALLRLRVQESDIQATRAGSSAQGEMTKMQILWFETWYSSIGTLEDYEESGVRRTFLRTKPQAREFAALVLGDSATHVRRNILLRSMKPSPSVECLEEAIVRIDINCCTATTSC